MRHALAKIERAFKRCVQLGVVRCVDVYACDRQLNRVLPKTRQSRPTRSCDARAIDAQPLESFLSGPLRQIADNSKNPTG